MKVALTSPDVWQLVHWMRLYRIDPTMVLDEGQAPRVKFGEVQFPLGHIVDQEKRTTEKHNAPR